ncbi:DUF3105 domain-containing protein [Candidatus Curtissbacteria bacterium]|nr:DUF3105 domain-containing protein [Candidatus Curtissbacteria bacterium]
MPTFIVLGVGVWYFTQPGADKNKDSDKPVPVARDVEGTKYFDIVGRAHITSGTPGSGFNSNPPTSGNHWPAPAKNGVYDKQLPDEQLIHNMEHGYIWVSYKPCSPTPEATASPTPGVCASDDVVKQLKGIVEADSWKMVLEPRGRDDGMIALAAWGRLLNLDNADYSKVKDFIKTYRNRGPEKTPD